MNWYSKWIWNEYQRLFAQEKIQPKVYNKIHITQLNKYLTPLCKNIYLSDEQYDLTSVEEAKKYCGQSGVQYRKYSEFWDCDNYSAALVGYWNENLTSFCFGICWSSTHAFSIMLDKDYKIWVIEPQTNEWLALEDIQKNPKAYKKYYPFQLILI